MIIPAALYLRFNHTSGSSLSLWDRVQRSVSLYPTTATIFMFSLLYNVTLIVSYSYLYLRFKPNL